MRYRPPSRIRLSTLTAVALVCSAIGLVQAQTRPGTYHFEVASIRPAAPDQHGTNFHTDRARFTTSNASLFDLITFAYDVRSYQITNAPDWVRTTHYDINAKYDEAEDDVNVKEQNRLESRNERIRARLRNLLAERFQLQLRQETKELPIYGMVEERGGNKWKVAADPKGGMDVSNNNGNGRLRGQGVTSARLAIALSSITERPVVDETGSTALLDFELHWSTDGNGDGGPTLFTALREQLGLRLEAKKGLVTTYAIEHVEKPSEN